MDEEKTEAKVFPEETPPDQEKELAREPVICVECVFLERHTLSCGHDQAPVTDFVTGRKDPYLINQGGDCLHFSRKDKE